MFSFFKKKRTEEEEYWEDLERRKQETAAHPEQTDAGFELTVRDVFTISGRGTVVTGEVSKGSLSNGAQVRLQGSGGSRTVFIDGIEAFRKVVERAETGDFVGLLLRDVTHEQVRSGDILRGI